MKTCYVCKLPKPLSDFHVDNAKRDRRQGTCKACTKIRNTAMQAAKPNYFKTKSAERYKTIGKAQNPERYAKYRTEYLKRRDAELISARGRLSGVLAAARTRSARYGRELSITLDWLMVRWDEIQGCCELTGIPMTLDRNPYGKHFLNPFNPSLDRRNSSEGYTPGNTRIVCVAVNIGKNHFSDDVYFRVCNEIAKRFPYCDLA